MALQIKGKFIEASTLDGDRVLLKWDGQTPSKGGALRFQKSAANGGGIVELISYDETSGKAIFKSGSTTEEYIFKSEILESTGADAGKLKASLMPSDVMLESEFMQDQNGTKVVKDENIASSITRDSEILESTGSDSGKFKESLMPAGVMLNSEFTELENEGQVNEVRVIKELNISEDIAREADVLLKSEFLSEAGKILKGKLEIPDDVVTESELYNSNGEGGTTGIIQNDRLAKTGEFAIARESSVLLKSEYLVGGKFDPSKLPALAITSVSVVANDAERDALTAEEGDVAVVTASNKSYIKDGSGSWQELKTPGQVSSVNGQTGTVTLTTTHVAEGSNEYFTAARAKSAVVVNSSAGSETDQAMSVSAAKSYAETQAAGKVEDAIVDGVTTKAPSQNAVYDALVLKYDAADFNGDFDDRLATKDTDDVAEGSANKYFTDARAQTAAVGDAIAEGVTTKAPSQNAVFNALALKASKTDINTAINALHVKESPITVSATPEQEFALAHKPAASSVMVSVGRLLLQEGIDYDVSEVSGSWKVVLKAGGPVASGGEEALEAGDKVFIKYMKEIALA